METDEIAALLERELELMSDDGEEDFELDLNVPVSSIPAIDADPEQDIQSELQELFQSANQLEYLSLDSAALEVSDMLTILVNEDAEPNSVPDLSALQSNTEIHKEFPELTEEERTIIMELLELMVESVERCAPIFARTKLAPMEQAPDIPQLQLITEDSDIALPDIGTSRIDEQATVVRHEQLTNLLDDRFNAETQLTKEKQAQAIQESDQVMWDETNRFKQEVEQERLRREERRLKREEAKRAAMLERSARSIQRVARGQAARRIARILREEDRVRRAAREAELAEERRLQLEAAQHEELRQQREREAMERRQMDQHESESRRVWAAIKALEEQRRQTEVTLFAVEDRLATQIRVTVLEARAKLEQYARLTAQDDEEYDFGGYGSDSDVSGAESDSEAVEVVEGSVRLVRGSSGVEARAGYTDQKNVTAQPQAQPAQTIASIVDKPSAGSTAASVATKPTGAPSMRPAPRAPKAVVKVDPRQGKRWGGALTTDSPTVAWDATSDQDGQPAGDAPAHEGSDQSEVIVKPPPPYTLAELATLEAQRLRLSRVTFRSAPLSNRAANSASQDDPGRSSLDSVLVASLKHWRERHSRIVGRSTLRAELAPITSAAINRKITAAASAQAERENEAALRNSMVDWETDPLLAQELDFNVEGLTSTTFLHTFQNLAKLTLNVNKLTELSGLSNLTALVSLSAKDNRISDVTPLAGLKKLRYLHLDSNRFSDLSGLGHLPELVVLCANSNQIAEMPQLHCPHLQRLELSRNRITTVADGCLRGYPALMHLNLSSNQISTLEGAALNDCPLLQTIALSENQLTSVPSPLRLPMLKSLRLNLNRLTTLEEWCHRSDAPWPMCAPSLQKLVLSDNQIATLPPGSFFEGLVLLEDLDLSFNALAEREFLLSLRPCKLLTSLHIQDNLFTTVPVTGATAGTSRTALPEPQLHRLLQWLLTVCPGLETVSGNRLDRAQYAEALAQLRSRDALEHYLKTGSWLSGADSLTSVGYRHQHTADRELISLLQAHQAAQNTLAVTERAVKKDEAAAQKNKSLSKRVDINPAAAAGSGEIGSLGKRDWDQELLNLLQGQLEQLKNFLSAPGEMDASVSKGVFISFKKGVDVLFSASSGCQPPVQAPVLSLSVAVMSGGGSVGRPSSGQATSLGASLPPCSGEKGRPTTMPVSHVTTLQSCFRGRRVRKRLGAALKSIRYQDDELDDLLGDGDDDFNLDAMLDLSYLDEGPPVAMVYGDHIRKRSRPGSSAKPSFAPSTESSASTVASFMRSSTEQLNNWVLPADDAHSPPKMASHPAMSQQKAPPFHELSRPSTGMSSLSAHSVASADAPDGAAMAYGSAAPSPAGSRSNLSTQSDMTGQLEGIIMMNSARKTQRAAQMAQEWGISDPKVLAAMLKRTQRLQSFEHEKQRKEMDKDPLHRLEKFQRTAGRPSAGAGAGAGGGGPAMATVGNTRTSGSFGGAPKTLRNGGGGKRRQMAMPAWMLGADDGAGAEGKDDEG